jgi:hypothetical protein
MLETLKGKYNYLFNLPVVGFLDYMVVLCLIITRTSILFSLKPVWIYVPNVCFSSHILQYVLSFVFFDRSHYNRSEMISKCGLDLHFPHSDAEHFLCTCWPFTWLFLRDTYSSVLAIFKSGYLFCFFWLFEFLINLGYY